MNKIIDILLFFGRMFGLFPKPSRVTAKIKIKSLFERNTLVKFRIRWCHPIVFYSLFFILFSVFATVDNFQSTLLPTLLQRNQLESADSSFKDFKPTKETNNFEQQHHYHPLQNENENENQNQNANLRHILLGGILTVKILSFFNTFVTDLLLRIGAFYLCSISSKLISYHIQNLLIEILSPTSRSSSISSTSSASSSSSPSSPSRVMEVRTISSINMQMANNKNNEMESMPTSPSTSPLTSTSASKSKEAAISKKEDASIVKYLILSTLLMILSSAVQIWHVLHMEIMNKPENYTVLLPLTSASTINPNPTIFFINEKVQRSALIFAGIIPIFSLSFSYLFVIILGLLLLKLYREYFAEVTRRFDNFKMESKSNSKSMHSEIMDKMETGKPEEICRVNEYDNPNPNPNPTPSLGHGPGPGHGFTPGFAPGSGYRQDNGPGQGQVGWQAHFEEFNYEVDTQPKRKLHPYPPPHPFSPHQYVPRFVPQPQPFPYNVYDEDHHSSRSNKYWSHSQSQVHPHHHHHHHQPKHSVFMVAKIANSTMKWGKRAKARCARQSVMRQVKVRSRCNGNGGNGNNGLDLDGNGNIVGTGIRREDDKSFDGILLKFEDLAFVFDTYNQVAGFYTLVIVCSAILSLVENLAWMTLENERNVGQKYAIAIVQCFVALSIILLTANFGEFLRSVIRRIRMKLQAHAVHKKDVGRRELDLINWITSWDFQFQALNIFKVNRGLIPRVLGTVMVSFLVILHLQILDR